MNTPIVIDDQIPVLDPASLPALSSVASKAADKAARRLTRRVNARRYARLTQHNAAVEQLRPLPEPGETVHGVMDGRFSGWQMATAIIELLGEPVEELTISTLGYNRENLESLIELINAGKIRSVLLNISNYFRHSDREIFADIRRQLEDRGHQVAVTRSHAKLLLFRTASRAIVVETSANLRSSMNFEQFAVTDDAALLTFHRQWISELIEESTCTPTV